ncbi:MAG TPA: glycosyltransferase family 4 protein [Candidatus Paceibacterota bacterium]|nr:glycosyltransferase family 4 protein [Candidatus Paceibacterota bacterium]
MEILIFNWKDRKNPLAGGAEIVTEELLKRLVKNGHRPTLLTSKFKGCQNKEIIDGYEIIRVGGRWTVYWQAYRYYKGYLRGKFDLVIDEINTIPFFAKFYAKEKNILFIHQLCREIWFYQIFFPLSLIGYLIEPIYLWLLRDRKVIAVSESTRNDLLKYGFKKENIYIISEGIEIEPLKELPEIEEIKEKEPTILFLGVIRAMKRPDQVIKAFELAKKGIKNLKLWIAGGGDDKYHKKVMRLINNSQYKKDITCLGKVENEEKISLLQKTHLLCVTSVKEGWGLVVIEANSQGTPAIVYNVDGLRDSVKNNETGLICQQNTSENLAKNIIKLLNDREKYQNLRINAWQWSKEINFERSYNDFLNAINGKENVKTK